MLQITVTVSANHEKVMEEAQILELEGIAKIHEHTSTLILNVPDQRNDEKVIAALAKLAPQVLTQRGLPFSPRKNGLVDVTPGMQNRRTQAHSFRFALAIRQPALCMTKKHNFISPNDDRKRGSSSNK
jgi:hypothetical protein